MSVHIAYRRTARGFVTLRRCTAIVFAAAALACSGGIDSLLEVEQPGTVSEPVLLNPANALLLVSGAQSDLHCALARYIVAGGAVGEEITWGDLNTFDFDRRTFTAASGAYATNTCANGIGVYTTLSTARYSADHTHQILSGFTDAEVPNRAVLMATMSAYAGYSLVLLGEAMCAASVDVGPKLSRAELMTMAEQRFTAAISEAGSVGTAASANVVNLARVGRARARINLSSTNASKAAEAAADALLVPDGFVWNASYVSTTVTSSNYVFYWINEQQRASIEGPFQIVGDPRVKVTNTALQAFDRITPLWTQQKYADRNAPIPIARWAEAQLIVAEVQGGAQAVSIINTLRARASASLPTFASSDPTAIRNQVIAERSRELFLEGQHLGDKIRFNLPFTPAAGSPFKQGLSYGTMTCFPYPDIEALNNPNGA